MTAPRATQPAPRVGIVLPVHNREELLPRAIESILAQDLGEWELIVVDDNSTDGTPEVIRSFRGRDPRIRSVRNDRYSHSCAGARRRGLDEIRHPFVAFLDSDDTWPPHHLSELAAALDAHPDVDWVFGDLRRLDRSGRVLVESKLRQEWAGREKLPRERRGDLFVLRGERLPELALEHELAAAFQPSLIRSQVFERVPYHEVPLCDDRLYVLQAAAAGVRFAYLLSPHLDFLLHEDNMSGANVGASFEHRERIQREVEEFWRRQVPAYVPMTRERRALVRRNLAEHRVWMLGNNVYRSAGRRWWALGCIGRGIAARPFEWRYWKTFAGTLFGIR